MSIINVLQEWFKSNYDSQVCTGIQISTNDKLQWQVSIDLFDTSYETKKFKDVCEQKDSENWFKCVKENQIFKGYGGRQNLEDILNVFYKWIIVEKI